MKVGRRAEPPSFAALRETDEGKFRSPGRRECRIIGFFGVGHLPSHENLIQGQIKLASVGFLDFDQLVFSLS
jgi:hypothetical protein